jgi:signal transduction histidine kinase
VRAPRSTVRRRLTLLYGGLFVIAGAALLAITYFLVAGNVGSMLTGAFHIASNGNTGMQVTVTQTAPPADLLGKPPEQLMQYLSAQAAVQRDAELRQLLLVSGIALAIMAGISVALGWLVAGRALRPLRVMTGKTRQISAANLHERLAMTGPDDELKELGDTIDELLGRLDAAFAAQKRFVANASHELRTPLTLQRATVEVALADPGADSTTLRAVCERVLAAGESQERMIEALLTLARSQRGLDVRRPVDVAAVARDVVAAQGSGLSTSIGPAEAAGDCRLVERLVANLVDNAVRHNVPGGWVRVATGTVDGRPMVAVANSGPVVPADRVGSLFQPFLRLAERTGGGDGHGLGLSIVAAIADAHDAEVHASANPAGGLTVTVLFPHSGNHSRRVSSSFQTTAPCLVTW